MPPIGQRWRPPSTISSLVGEQRHQKASGRAIRLLAAQQFLAVSCLAPLSSWCSMLNLAHWEEWAALQPAGATALCLAGAYCGRSSCPGGVPAAMTACGIGVAGRQTSSWWEPAKESNSLSLAGSAHLTVLSRPGCNAASCLKGLHTKHKLLMATSMVNQRSVSRSRAATLSVLLLLAEAKSFKPF